MHILLCTTLQNTKDCHFTLSTTSAFRDFELELLTLHLKMGLSSIFVLPQNITAISIPMKYIISWTKPYYRNEKRDQKDKMTLIFKIK